MDTSNLNISSNHIDNSVKNSDKSDEDIFVFNSSENSVNTHNNSSKTFSDNGRSMEDVTNENLSNMDWRGKAVRESPVWCMDFCNDLIILGCADGRLEFWEASTGKLMVSIVNPLSLVNVILAASVIHHWNFNTYV